MAALAILGAAGDYLGAADDARSPRDSTAPAAQDTPSNADIDRWIADLDADQFAVRESASRKLRSAGQTVIGHLAETADGPHAEASARAVAILEEWSRSEQQPELQLAALARLAALEHHSALRRRAEAELAVHRERRALKRLMALGAKLPRIGVLTAHGGGAGSKMVIDQDWKGSPEDLALLRHLQAVHYVGYWTTASAKMVEAAAEMPALERLELYGTGIAPEEIARLQKGMPHVEFDVRQGAMLGVGGSGGRGRPAIISRVEPNSAAARAGLRPNDIVTKVDDRRVADFEALTAEIAKRAAGDQAILEIRRGGTTLRKKVVLGRWTVLDDAPLEE